MRHPFRLGVALLDAKVVLRVTLIGMAVAATTLAVALLVRRIGQALGTS